MNFYFTTTNINLELLVLCITAVILIFHAHIMVRSSSAAAFKSVYDILQDEKVRTARRVVLSDIKGKDISQWTK